MSVTDTTPVDRQSLIEELRARIRARLPEDGRVEIFPGVFVYRASTSNHINHSMSLSALAVIAQGSKQVVQGDRILQYDPEHFLIGTMQMPVQSCVLQATPDVPYLSFSMQLDPKVVASVILDAGLEPSDPRQGVGAMGVSKLDDDLLETVLRLVRIADDPARADFLGPMGKRELIYKVLLSPQGDALRQYVVNSGPAHRVSRAIDRLKAEFDQPLRIPEIANDLGMSVSGFHHHFKTVTGMSPLQFQKQLRLREARRLMLGDDLDAASAGFRVGYDDASHFSREYKRLFGNPPMRDIEHLRATGAALQPIAS